MPAEIIRHKAKKLTVNFEENFESLRNRIRTETQKPLEYENGAPIEITPNTQCSFLFLELERLATEEEFELICGAVLQTVEGILPGLVKKVGTPFDASVPSIPQKFLDELEEDQEMKVFLRGETHFEIEKHYKPVEPVAE